MSDATVIARPARRAQQACDTCRRKKTRCPGEKPACSACRRTRTACHYSTPAVSRSHPAWPAKRSSILKERVEELEQKVALFSTAAASSGAVLRVGDDPRDPYSGSEQGHPRWATQSNYMPRPVNDSSNPQRVPRVGYDPSESFDTELPPSHILSGLAHLYVKRFDGQPLPLFAADGLCTNLMAHGKDVLYAVIGITMQFAEEASVYATEIPSAAQYIAISRRLVMDRVETGMVDLCTLQSICLLAYEDLISGNTQRASVFIGIGLRLARAAGLQHEQEGSFGPVETEERRRCFWSLRLLDTFSSFDHDALARLPCPVPPYPRTEINYSTLSNGAAEKSPPRESIYKWTISIAELWSQVLSYTLSGRASDDQPAWGPQSHFTKLELLVREFEMTLSDEHRWHTLGILERKGPELRQDMAYWGSWLFLQFTFHATRCLLYHPYNVALMLQQRASDVPQHFRQQCQSSSQLHANWIDRFICLIEEKEVRISDPFLAHCAAVAATVYLFSENNAPSRTQSFASEKIYRCLRFIQGLGATWPIAKRVGGKLSSLSDSITQWKMDEDTAVEAGMTNTDLKGLVGVLTYPPAQDACVDEFQYLHQSMTNVQPVEGGGVVEASSCDYDEPSRESDSEGRVSISRDLLTDCSEYMDCDWDQALLGHNYLTGYL